MCVTPVADITIKSISEEDYANSLIIWNDISPVDIENDVVWNDISPVDFENDVVRCIRSFSLNNLIDGSHMQDLIPSSWGRSSATFSTHFEYSQVDKTHSKGPYLYTFIQASRAQRF